MSAMMFLSDTQLRELTAYKVRERQRVWLSAHGIPYRLAEGRLIVMAAHVEAWVNGKELKASAGPKLDLVR